MLARDPQVDRQRVALGEQAAHRRGVGVTPALSERVDTRLLGNGHRVQTGCDGVGQVRRCPIMSGLDVGLGVFGRLARLLGAIFGAVDQAALAQGGAQVLLVVDSAPRVRPRRRR